MLFLRNLCKTRILLQSLLSAIFLKKLNPELAKELLCNNYKLINLQSMPDQEIKQKEYLGLMEMFMKHIHTRDLLKLWKDAFKNFEKVIVLDAKNDYDYIKALVWYTEAKIPEDKQEELFDLFHEELSIDGENIMRSLAQKYVDQGFEQGINQGISEVVIRMLNMGKSSLEIANITGI